MTILDFIHAGKTLNITRRDRLEPARMTCRGPLWPPAHLPAGTRKTIMVSFPNIGALFSADSRDRVFASTAQGTSEPLLLRVRKHAVSPDHACLSFPSPGQTSLPENRLLDLHGITGPCSWLGSRGSGGRPGARSIFTVSSRRVPCAVSPLSSLCKSVDYTRFEEML